MKTIHENCQIYIAWCFKIKNKTYIQRIYRKHDYKKQRKSEDIMRNKHWTFFLIVLNAISMISNANDINIKFGMTNIHNVYISMDFLWTVSKIFEI